MNKTTTYVGILNGVNGLWCGFKPEGLEVTEEREVLHADEGKILINKKTYQKDYSVVLSEEVLEEDYDEINDNTVEEQVEE